MQSLSWIHSKWRLNGAFLFNTGCVRFELVFYSAIEIWLTKEGGSGGLELLWDFPSKACGSLMYKVDSFAWHLPFRQ